MMLLYWHPRRLYVEHLLFFVHNHAFAFLLFGLFLLTSSFVPAGIRGWLTAAVWLYVPYYLFRAMRRVYGEGRLWTLTKLVVLSLGYFFGGAITLAVTSLYSVMML